MIQNDLPYHKEMAKDIIEKNKNVRCLKRKEDKQWILAIKSQNKEEGKDKHERVEITWMFYENLYPV